MKIINQAYKKAIEVLKACDRSNGFFASGLPGGYEAVWARDSMITSLGALTLGDQFRTTIKKSLQTLVDNQSKLGQIPNCVGSYNQDRGSEVTFNTIDSSLWFILGSFNYAETYQDRRFFNQIKPSISAAFRWLEYQDPDEVGLIAQQPTMDWQDAFPHKYGYVLNSHALYYAALTRVGQNEKAQKIKDTLNGKIRKYMSLYDPKLGYYYPWAWKNHDGDREHEEWFDSLGNLLAIISGLATPDIAKNIINHIEKEKINRPYPVKAIWPPIKPGDKEWHSYFDKCDAREPLSYLNAGIWPFIGAFYVVALVALKQYKKAASELALLAEGNLQKILLHHPEHIDEVAIEVNKSAEEVAEIRAKEFNEWLHGGSGKPRGEPFQAWSAGAFIWAKKCCEEKSVIYF